MQKKRVLKITPVLITLNILVLFVIAGFYITRLVKYYLEENGPSEDSTVFLAEEIKKKRSYMDETKGLVFNEKTGEYIYKGNVEDNYLYYSGIMYRILGIDKNGNIKAISENNITLIYPGFDKGYKDSYVNRWLNESEEKGSGIFEKTLVNSKSLLENNLYCSDSIDDVTKITCEKEITDYKITLLSLNDYKIAGGKESFLNSGFEYNLGTLNKDNLNYYVTKDGDIAIHQRKSAAITLRPVITFNKDIEALDGNGEEDYPYMIERHSIKSLADTYVGNIVKLDDRNYKVIEQADGKTKVVSTEVLMESKDKPLEIAFGGSDNSYSTDNEVGEYLNSTFLNSLKLKDSVVDSDFNIGLLALDNYDYMTLRNSTVKAKVGLLTMGEMYVCDQANTLTILRGIEEPNLINVISENGGFFADDISSKYNVNPAFYLKNDLKVISGNGTIDNPYVLGVNNEGKEGKEN